MWVVGLPAAFGASDTVQLLSANIGLMILLLYFPGGFVQVLYECTGLPVGTEQGPCPPHRSRPPRRNPQRSRSAKAPWSFRLPKLPWLRTSRVNVHFGGVVAVSDVSIEVFSGEVVGLIGTNGAGKTTLMNAISGFVPNDGSIDGVRRRVSGQAGLPPRHGGPGRAIPEHRAASAAASPFARR